MPRNRMLGPDWDLVEFEHNPHTGRTVGVYDYPKRTYSDADREPRSTVVVRGSNGELPHVGIVEDNHPAGAQIDTGQIPGVMPASLYTEYREPARYSLGTYADL